MDVTVLSCDTHCQCMQGSGLDAYAKQWRLFADVFNNVGTPPAHSSSPNKTATKHALKLLSRRLPHLRPSRCALPLLFALGSAPSGCLASPVAGAQERRCHSLV